MKRILFSAFFASVLATGLAVANMCAAAGVTDEDILNDEKTTNQVVTSGLGLRGQRYSPLDKVNSGNVKNLVPVWTLSFGGEKQRGQETQALVYDGIIYVTASYSRLFAIDAKTGSEIWEYNARLVSRTVFALPEYTVFETG